MNDNAVHLNDRAELIADKPRSHIKPSYFISLCVV
jgi:hypothetical protein